MFTSFCSELNKIRTPEGDTRVRYLKSGDQFYSSNGELDTINTVTQEQERTFFRICYSDGRCLFAAHEQILNVKLKKKKWKWQEHNPSYVKSWIRDQQDKVYMHPIYPERRVPLGLDIPEIMSSKEFPPNLLLTSPEEKVAFLKRVFRNTNKNKISIKNPSPDLCKILIPLIYSMGGSAHQANEWLIIYFDAPAFFGHEEVSFTPYHVIERVDYIGKLPTYKITANSSVVFDNYTTFSLKI